MSGFPVALLWFSFILVLLFIFLCFKLTIIHNHTQKQRKMNIDPVVKLKVTIISFGNIMDPDS